MIRHQRSGQAKVGKHLEVIQFAKEVADYVNTKYAPVSVQVYSELFGVLNTIYWHTDYNDLASLEDLNAQLIADPGYLAIVSKASDIFIDGSLHDTLMRSV
jgi:hypothetical protein